MERGIMGGVMGPMRNLVNSGVAGQKVSAPTIGAAGPIRSLVNSRSGGCAGWLDVSLARKLTYPLYELWALLEIL